MVGGAVRDALARRDVADIDLATGVPPEAGDRGADARPGIRAVPTGHRARHRHRGRPAASRLRDHYPAPRRADRRTARRGGLHRRLAGGRGAARLHHQRAVDDPRRRGVRLFRRHRRPARRAWCASSAIRRPASPRTTCASCASSASTRATAAGRRTRRRWRRSAPAVPALARLSAERVWSELKPHPGRAGPARRGGADGGDCGVLAAVLPGGRRIRRGWSGLVDGGAPGRCAAAAGGAARRRRRSSSERLRLAGAEHDRLSALGTGAVPADDADDDTLRRALADTPGDILEGGPGSPGAGAALRGRLAAMPRPVFPLRGRDLRAAGLPPGPGLGEMLGRIRDWWMAGGCLADAASCRAELARLLAD